MVSSQEEASRVSRVSKRHNWTLGKSTSGVGEDRGCRLSKVDWEHAQESSGGYQSQRRLYFILVYNILNISNKTVAMTWPTQNGNISTGPEPNHMTKGAIGSQTCLHYFVWLMLSIVPMPWLCISHTIQNYQTLQQFCCSVCKLKWPTCTTRIRVIGTVGAVSSLQLQKVLLCLFTGPLLSYKTLSLHFIQVHIHPCVSSAYPLICFNLVVWILSFLFISPCHHPLYPYMIILYLVMIPPFLFTSTF